MLRWPLSVLVSLLLALSSSAAAQEPDESEEGVEQITITGQRSHAEAQSQAIAITAFSQAELDQLGITRISDLQANIPSIHIAQSGTQTLVTLRGVGIENTNLSGEPGVLFIVDGIPILDVGAIDGAFFDVSSVLALRGPQGTQGHKNSSGGWIEVNSVPPQPDFVAQGDYQIGTYNQHVWRWALNVPISGDWLMTRISGRFEDRDGYQRAMRFYDPIHIFDYRPIPAKRSDDFNSAHDLSTRFQLRTLAIEGLDLRLIGTYGFLRGNAVAPHLLSDPGIASARYDVRFPRVLARSSDDPNWNRTNIRNPLNSRSASATLLATQDLKHASLGDLRLSATVGYFRSDRAEVIDGDATDRDALVLYKQTESRQYSGELTLETVDSRPWDWKLGVFYLRDERRQFGALLRRPFRTSRIFQEIESDSLAGFFELSYWLTERFKLMAGARYSHDSRRVADLGEPVKIEHPSIAPYIGRLGRSGQTSLSDIFPSFTPKILAQWQWSDTSHVALSVTKGAKPGGFPLGSRCQDVACRSYANEQVWQYELTSKNDFLDERLRMNLSLFWTNYDPYQYCIVIGFETQCYTQGQATTRGVEVELLAWPTPELAINLNFNLLDGRIDEFRLIDRAEPKYLGSRPPERNPLSGVPQDVSGHRMTKAPKYNMAAGVQYDVHLTALGLPGWGTLTPRVQYQFQSRTYFRPWNLARYSQSSFTKVDVRLAWRSHSGRWSVEGFVNNVADVDIINYVQVGGPDDGTVFGFYQPPRTAGIRLGLHY